MEIKIIKVKDKEIVHVENDGVILSDAQSAVDLIMDVKYQTGIDRIAISKKLVTEDFFILSSGIAGEVLQKFINYHCSIAIYGDYSRYTSKPLKDFIYESNKGKDIFFTDDLTQALEKLSK